MSEELIPQLQISLEQLAARLKTTPGASIAGLLPLLFTYEGRPLDICTNYFLHEPVFKLHGKPRKTILKASRQVGKSLGAAAESILLTALIPNFKVMLAFPLQSQTNWFSSNYVAPLIRGSPLFRHLSLSAEGSDAVGQRDIGENGSMYFRYIGNGADRARGSKIDGVAIDECVSRFTLVSTELGPVWVSSLKPGDIIHAADSELNCCTDRVTAVLQKGTRPTWRITLDDGSCLDCTDNEKFRTTSGWMYLSEIHEAVSNHARAGGTPAGESAGRRQHERKPGPWVRRRTSSLEWAPAGNHEPWAEAGSLCSPQVPEAANPLPYRPRSAAEPGVRQLRVPLLDEQPTFSGLPVPPVLRVEWSEVCQGSASRDAGPADVSVTGLLADGRRVSEQGNDQFCQSRVHEGGECPLGELVDVKGLRRFRIYNAPEGEGLLLAEAIPRGVVPPVAGSAAVRDPGDELQAGLEATSRIPVGNMRAVWSACSQPSTGLCDIPVQSDVPEAPCVGCQETELQEAQGGGVSMSTYRAATRSYKREGSGTAAGEASRPPRESLSAGKASRASLEAEGQPGAPGQAQARASAIPCQEDGEIKIYTRSVRGVPGAQEHLTPRAVQTVEYIGEQPVYDIELEKHHCFFANGMLVHNCQDLDPDNVEVVIANMTASPYKFQRFSGTPKTRDNYIEVQWQKSSQGVWTIKCDACNHWNSASPDDELIKMLGKDTLICAKCGRPVNSRAGIYKHRFPERVHTFAGYEQPGPVLPRCYENPKEWAILKDAQENKPPYIFINEYCGGSFDSGAKLITWEELERACTLEPREMSQLCPTGYIMSSVGADWGGKGKQTDASKEEFISNTAMVASFLRDDHRIEVQYLHTSPYESSYEEEADFGLALFNAAGATWFAHDAGGGGDLRQSFMTQRGLPLPDIAPYTYGRLGPDKPIVYYKPPEREGARVSYTVDKTRAIMLVIQLIKRGYILFPKIGHSRKFLDDFMALFEETRESPTGAPRKIIRRISNKHDDIVHAIVFSVLILYHHTGLWPQFARDLHELVGSAEAMDET